MISFIRGKVFEITPTYVVIDSHDIGYHVHISLNTYSKIQAEKTVFLYTILVVREDAHLLYGFMNVTERNIFKLLVSVSGIGANTAMLILSAMTAKEIQQVIVNEDVVGLTKIKGIGTKTAKRMIIELKDKILKTYDIEPGVSDNQNFAVKNEAVAALEALGFPKKTCEKVVGNLLKEKPEISLEDTIKEALKRF